MWFGAGRPLRECTFDDKFGKGEAFLQLPGSGLLLGRTIVPGIGMWEVSWAVLDVEGVEIGKEVCSSGGDLRPHTLYLRKSAFAPELSSSPSVEAELYVPWGPVQPGHDRRDSLGEPGRG